MVRCNEDMGKIYKRATVSTYQTGLLQSRAYRAFTGFMTDFLSDMDLSLPQWIMLGVLYDNGTLQPVQIADQLGVKPPVATTLINDLERKRLLERKPHETDSRSSLITLTSRGRNIVSATEKRLHKELRTFMGELSLPEIVVYTRVVAKLAARSASK